MRVLFISSREGGDWGMDLLFAGLVKNIGAANVYDFPSRSKHRMGKTELTLVGDPEKDWGTERRSLAYTPDSAALLPCSNESEVKRLAAAGGFDYIFTDERQEAFEIYVRLGLHLTKIPVVVVAGHDRFWNFGPEIVRQNYYKQNLHRMYIDNWKPAYDSLPYARKYSWAANFDHLWDPEFRKVWLPRKVYDVSFMGYNSHPNRKRYLDHVRKKWPHLRLNLVLEERPNSFSMFKKKEDYFKDIAHSRICLNLRGAAENGKAMRFYEIPYVGSFMLSEFFPGLPDTTLSCPAFKDEGELDNLIAYYLANPDYRETAARDMHDDLMQNHTVEKRVHDMLEDICGPSATVRQIGRTQE